MASIWIAKSGKLFGTRSSGFGEDEEHDLTDQAPRFLFRPCSVKDDVTVRDIFLLLKRHRQVFRNLSKDVSGIVEEGLKLRRGNKRPFSIALISWNIGYSEGSLSSNTDPILFLVDNRNKLKYGPEAFPAYEIAKLPLKLSRRLVILNHDLKMKEVFANPDYTLGQIIWAIIDGLSWFGTPGQRKMSMSVLKEKQLLECSLCTEQEAIMQYSPSTKV